VWELSPEVGKYGVRVSRYFQRNSLKDGILSAADEGR
jgi:hypothetical protein